VLAFGLVACGDDDEDGGGGGSGTDGGTSAEGGGGGDVTIYSSFPLQGTSRPQSEAIINGIELAFKEAGNEAAGVTIDYQSLDDATAQAGAWTPELESANAKRAAQDDSAVLYLGPFNSGAAAISIPITNEAGLAHISPTNTAVGLTSDDPGADEGEPEIYYPTGERNYARIVPKDTVQGAALATVMDEDGCTTVAVLHDQEVYGAGLAENIELASEGLGYEIVSNEGIDPKAPNYRSVAEGLAGQSVDCFAFSGITANGAVQLFKDVHAAIPDVQMYGPDGIAESPFFDPAEGGVPTEVGAQTKISIATLDPGSYGPEGEKFFETYSQEYNDETPETYAIYGYELGLLALDVLERAEDPTDRASVLEALFSTENRESLLGTYSLDENGDTTLTDYGIYAIEGGALVFDQKVEAAVAE
jgi:branched-chain amino acid transport system substrate-binding protein